MFYGKWINEMRVFAFHDLNMALLNLFNNNFLQANLGNITLSQVVGCFLLMVDMVMLSSEN
ncbi:MAG: hypothetical protein M3512_04720 [Bacteroidota bacterium]|nr:hypothetical protein [Bacteroidota bacterium]